MAKGKGKKGKRRGDDSDESDGGGPPAAAKDSAAGGDDNQAGLSRKQKRAQKAKGKQQRNNVADDDDDDHLIPQVKENYGSDSDEEREKSAPTKKLTKKQLKRLKEKEEAEARAKAAAFAGDDSDDDDDDEEEAVEEEIPQPSKKSNKKQKGKQKGKQSSKFALSDDEDDDDESEDEPMPPPSSKNNKQQNKKQKGKNASKFKISDDEEEEENTEEEEIHVPSKKNKKQNKKQKGKQASKFALSDDEDEESDEEEIPPPSNRNKKQSKKQKGKQTPKFADEDDEESEKEEIPQPSKKSKKQSKKQKGKQVSKFALSDDEDEEEESEEEEIPQPSKKNNKQHKKNKGKQNSKFALSDDDDEEDESEEEEIPQHLKHNKKQSQKKKGKKSSKFALSDDEDEEDESEQDIPQQTQKLSKKQQKKQKEKEDAEAAAKAEMFEDDDEDSKDDDIVKDMEEMNIDDESGDEGGKKKKKDKKKDKKDKKSKLERKLEKAAALAAEEKKSAEDEMDVGSDEEDVDDEAKEKAKKKAEKAARKAEKEAKKARKAEKEAKKTAKLEKKSKDDDDDDGEKDEDAGGDEDEVFYGAPDDHAWTDKSHAIKESDKQKDEGPDLSLIYGPDGKKLSNKERKKALKAKEAAARAAEYEKQAAKASMEGAQFACSQTAVNENDPQWQNSLDINIPSFNISAAGKILFKDAQFNIAHGRRYGLVGANGRGKSTLLKMIASRDLILPPRVDFLYVEQEVQADNTPAVDAVLKADKVRWNLLEEEKVLAEAIDSGDDDPKKFSRLQEVLDELNTIGAASAEAKARRILFGLGFDGEMQTKPTKMFSGGWRMRISLARALFIEPTLLMLDEPTNHLDLNAVIWLDNYLLNWKKTLLIVSHDQDFLNSVCDEILHIEDLKLASYKGNYDSFKKAEAAKLKQQLKDWEKQEKRLRELKRQGQSKAKATETVKKNKREPGARAAKKEKEAIASGAKSAETVELIKRPKEYTVQISFPEVAELSRPVMEVNQVFFRYSEKHPVIFDCVDFGIDMDSRICVVGPNGAGKSTLLKLLTGEIQPVKGEVKRNPRLRMGIYNQHFVDRLPMSKTPVEHLRDRFQDEDYQSVRNRLGKYGLEGHAHEVTMRDLSGGQKARVVFVELSLQRPHILLLDEPTNNLDIETIDALIKAINEFNGGIVVVTHDQRLIDECDCELWVVEEQEVKVWSQGFDHYKDDILERVEKDAKRDEQLRNEKIEAAAKAREEKLARFKAKMKK